MSVSIERIVLGNLENNTYIVTDENGDCAVIDPAIESEQLNALLGGKNVKYILLTHGHFDHIMGANSVKELTDAQIVIHKDDEICLSDENASVFALEYPNKAQPYIKADILTEDGTELPFGNSVIKVMHTSGHSKGSVCYIFEDDRIIFSGDTLFRLSAGRTDLYGGNARGILYSLSRLSELSGDYTVYTGHGNATTLEFERQNNRYMRRRHANSRS